MITNSRNDVNDNDHYNYRLRKVSFWEKYGVTSFPYRGKHRYTPFVYRSVDGGIIISNDVFGLTIRQFDQMYKACLARRKTKEQYILNLRYPDKSSDEYMDYLRDSTDCNKDNLSCTGYTLRERLLYQHLVKTAGAEIYIRKRQQLFLTQDRIHNAMMQQVDFKSTKISSGSLAEGIDLQGSDMDIMYVIEDVDVIRCGKNIKHPIKHTTLVMETDNDYPGFTRLRLLAGGEGECHFITFECFESSRKGLYLSANTFVSNINRKVPNYMLSSHGPCLSDSDEDVDLAFCLQTKYLPYMAIPWASRNRMQWPPNFVIDQIRKNGCLLVAIGPRTLPDCNVLWRLSFSVAEKLLVHSFNYTQLLCYCLLKLTLKYIVNKDNYANGLLCSYFLKTAVFWVSEEVDIDTFQLSKLYSCFSLCLSKLIFWVKNCYCPNYFIPEQNMFLGKINSDNNKILINVLDSIKCEGVDRVITNLFQHDDNRLLGTQRESSSTLLDFLFYKISEISFVSLQKISQCMILMEFTKHLRKSKSSPFIVNVCKYHYAQTSQYAAQLLPPPTVTPLRYNIHKYCYQLQLQLHLQDGIKTDAVSGWLLYASFYYVTGRFNDTLNLIEYVLSRCLPDIIPMGIGNYRNGQINYYRNNVHSTMTLRDKMRMAVVDVVEYAKHSSLIPKELQLEVEYDKIHIPPVVMSHCLKFLCYHHLGDVSMRQKSLADLESTVITNYLMPINTLSTSTTILGVCFEISDDKDNAYRCYDEALRCEGFTCLTANIRKSNHLLNDFMYSTLHGMIRLRNLFIN